MVRSSRLRAAARSMTAVVEALVSGLMNRKWRGPAGAPEAVTVSTGNPVRAEASSPGLPMVAEEKTKAGREP